MMNDQIAKAISILKNGGIVIFPTDTAFGIGCRIDNEQAVKRLFTLRRRPESQAVPVLVNGLDMAKDYFQSVPTEVEDKLIKPHWPGALTIILPAQTEKIPSLVLGGGKTIGMRQPNHETMQSIISGVGVPILGPSANFNTHPTPYSFEELDPTLISLVDFVVEGNCSVKQASTVIDCSVKPWKILRQGGVTLPL